MNTKVQQIKRMTGVIHTSFGDLYVKNYYANGHVVKFTLTTVEDEQIPFVGATIISYGKSYYHKNDSRYQGPNYGPLMNVRDVLSCAEMQYIGFKSIDVSILDFEDNILNSYPLPERKSKFNTIYGKKANVIDESTGAVTEFKVTKETDNQTVENEPCVLTDKLFD